MTRLVKYRDMSFKFKYFIGRDWLLHINTLSMKNIIEKRTAEVLKFALDGILDEWEVMGKVRLFTFTNLANYILY